MIEDYDTYIINDKINLGGYEIMSEYMITKSSIINRCNKDGKIHFFFAEVERLVVKNLFKLMEFRNTSKAFAIDGKFEILDTIEFYLCLRL